MATPHLGHGAFIAMAAESTWGTANTTWTNWLEVISIDPQAQITHERVPTHGRVAGSFVRDRSAQTTAYYRLTIETVLSYDDSTQLLLAHALWRDPSTTGTGPYAHTYEIDVPYDDGDTGAITGLTIGIARGVNDELEVYEGCVCTAGSIRIDNSGGSPVAVLRTEWIAEVAQDRTTRPTPTFTSNGEPVLNHQGGNVTFNSVAYCMRTLELSWDYQLSERNCISSQNTQIPAPTGFTDVTLTVQLDDPADAGKIGTLYDAYQAQTQSDVTWTMTGAGNNSIDFTLQNAEVHEFADPPQQGVTQIDATFRGHASSADTEPGLKIVCNNDNAAHTAN